MKMNKAELIQRVVKKTGLKKVDVGGLVNAMFEVIEDALKAGENVTITGFGSFKVVERKAREGRNPQTGQPIKIPAKKVVKFKPGKGLAKIS